jgi:hypothetical protein
MVKEHFNLKVWVCVSDPFDVVIAIKIILEAITLSPCNISDLKQLQIKLEHREAMLLNLEHMEVRSS